MYRRWLLSFLIFPVVRPPFRPILLPPRRRSLAIFPLLPSILGISISYSILNCLKPANPFILRLRLGLALLPRAHVCPEWNLRGPQHHHLLHHHQQQQVCVVTIKDTTIILTTTRPTISNSGSSTSSSTNQNTDSDTIINTPMNTNTNTAGRRRRRSTRRDKKTPERFVQFIRESLPDNFVIFR